MFRLIKKGPVLTHKCLQCGLTISYGELATRACTHCNATQRIKTFNTRTEFAPDFFLGGNFIWRTLYHLEETNGEDHG